MGLPSTYDALIAEMCASPEDSLGFIPIVDTSIGPPCDMDIAFEAERLGQIVSNETIVFGHDFPPELRSKVEAALIDFASSDSWQRSVGNEYFYDWDSIVRVP
jgi:hypothetical protein